MNGHVVMMVAALMLSTLTTVAGESWVLFGSARGFTTGCDPSYIWATETIFHNTAASDRQIGILHHSGTTILPPSITVAGGESRSLFFGNIPPSGLEALKIDVPSDVIVESRLQYWNVQPCVGLPPPLGPSGKIGLLSFHLTDAGQPQHHYGLDLGIEPVRVNVGVYNAGTSTATATIELRRPKCNNPVTTVLTVPPDTLVQVRVPIPPICDVSANDAPFWIVNGTVTVDQPSFSYATSVSNVQAPHVTFGVGTP